MAGNEVPHVYMDYLLDRLNTESALSGALYVALIGLWTAVVEHKSDIPHEMMYTVAEAISKYEQMHPVP